MTEPAADAYHQTVEDNAATNRAMQRILVALAVALLILAVGVIVWGAERLDSTAAIANCQTQALDQVLTELANAQQATLHHRPVALFVYPTPC